MRIGQSSLRMFHSVLLAGCLAVCTTGKADVIHGVPPGAGESNWTTPWAPANVEGTPAFVNFEGLSEGQILGEIIPGVKFTTTQGQDWRVGTWSSRRYNGKYPSGAYTSQGDAWAWLGVSQGAGVIQFTKGKATYFSCLSSTASGVVVDAYDENNKLVASSGWASNNISTGAMDRVTVISPFRNIQYVTIHDTGNYWLIDCISTDAPGVGTLLTVPSFKQYDPPWKDDLIVEGETIKHIGCALTSVAMVLASYGFLTVDVGDPGSPDLKALDPGTLNIWLKKHGGYTDDGDILWNKVDVLTGGKIVFGGGGGVDYAFVNNALAFRQPVILKEPGHWVVARGKQTNDINDETKNWFLINDPGHTYDSLDNLFYNRKWFGYRSYVPGTGVVRPAMTIRMHSPAEVMITDQLGRRTGYDAVTGTYLNEIPGASSFDEGPINDLETGVMAVPGHKEVYLPDAGSGMYQITVTGTGTGGYKLDIETRDAAGKYNTVVLSGITVPGKIDEYAISTSTANAGFLAVTSAGSLKGSSLLKSSRVGVAANLTCDGTAAQGLLLFILGDNGVSASSTGITTATFEAGAANIQGTCSVGSAQGYRYSLAVIGDATQTYVSFTITDPSGKPYFSAEGFTRSPIRITEN